MFERFAEKSRRVIFFARYEASQFGSPVIEPEHLLLGLLREDKALASRFFGSPESIDALRKTVEAKAGIHERVSTSVDLPLSSESIKALRCAADEASDVSEIGPGHLLLGLLRLKSGLGFELLERSGLFVETVRAEMERSPVTGRGGMVWTRVKTTACRDCKHLIVDGAIAPENLLCGASPKAVFDCYSGEYKIDPNSPPSERLQLRATVNLGQCKLFEKA